MGQGAQESDATLVRQAAGGDVSAFETLVHRYQDRIFGVVHRLVGDRGKAEDLSQETFLKAWRGLRSFQGQSGFYTWLYRIARNAVISSGRYDAARPRIGVSLSPDDDDEESPRLTPESDAPPPTEEALSAERRELVLDAIERLPGEFREIIVLRDMEDRSYEEISELLDVPIGTVRSRLHRARNELKERLRRVLDPAG